MCARLKRYALILHVYVIARLLPFADRHPTMQGNKE